MYQVGVLLCFLIYAQAATVIIDHLNHPTAGEGGPQEAHIVVVTTPVTQSSVWASGSGNSDMLGNERDMCLRMTSGAVDSDGFLRILTGSVRTNLNLDVTQFADWEIVWDGVDGAADCDNAASLSQTTMDVDLTGGGTNNGLRLNLFASPTVTGIYNWEVYSGAGNRRRLSWSIPTGQAAGIMTFPFRMFNTGVTGTVDWTHVTSLRFYQFAAEVSGDGIDSSFSTLETVPLYSAAESCAGLVAGTDTNPTDTIIEETERVQYSSLITISASTINYCYDMTYRVDLDSNLRVFGTPVFTAGATNINAVVDASLTFFTVTFNDVLCSLAGPLSGTVTYQATVNSCPIHGALGSPHVFDNTGTLTDTEATGFPGASVAATKSSTCSCESSGTCCGPSLGTCVNANMAESACYTNDPSNSFNGNQHNCALCGLPTGACCRTNADCTDGSGVDSSTCPNSGTQTFHVGETCASVPCTGSCCCNTVDCGENMLRSACVTAAFCTGATWTLSGTCAATCRGGCCCDDAVCTDNSMTHAACMASGCGNPAWMRNGLATCSASCTGSCCSNGVTCSGPMVYDNCDTPATDVWDRAAGSTCDSSCVPPPATDFVAIPRWTECEESSSSSMMSPPAMGTPPGMMKKPPSMMKSMSSATMATPGMINPASMMSAPPAKSMMSAMSMASGMVGMKMHPAMKSPGKGMSSTSCSEEPRVRIASDTATPQVYIDAIDLTENADYEVWLTTNCSSVVETISSSSSMSSMSSSMGMMSSSSSSSCFDECLSLDIICDPCSGTLYTTFHTDADGRFYGTSAQLNFLPASFDFVTVVRAGTNCRVPLMTFEITPIFDPPVSPPPPASSSSKSSSKSSTRSSSNVLANMFDTLFGGQEVETEVTDPQTVVTSAEKGAIAATVVSVAAAAVGGFGAFFLISRRRRGENTPLLS